MNDQNRKKEFAGLVQIALIAVAVISILCAILHTFRHDLVIDKDTAIFLGLAVLALMGPQITKFKGFGIEVEKEVEKLKEDVRSVEVAFEGLEKDVGPGSKAAGPTSQGSKAAVALSTPQNPEGPAGDAPPVTPDDPNKGRFGGSPEANGRKLSATIEPSAGPKSSRCRVTIRVESTDPSRPLSGHVTLYLHPTFGQWSSYPLEVTQGVAQEVITSYGAFTIGAEADEGATRLELDLMNVRGGTDRFYEE